MSALDTIIVQRYGTNTEDEPPNLALVVSECEAPTFGLIAPDGHHYNWRQDLTRPATQEETVAYWKDRALRAEAKHETE